MIDKLDIQNFQSWQSSSLEFSKGVNVIVGPSDSGKSAVIRALELVKSNRPSGNEFRSYDWILKKAKKKETIVTILNDKSEQISRIKGDKENSYAIEERESGCFQEFKAFGQSIPEEVSKALNLNSINLQEQHDSPFMLSESPGEVARHLNRIVNLEKIDSSMLHANQRAKKVNTDISYKKTEIESLESELESYEWLEKAEIDLKKLEEKELKISELETEHDSLLELVNDILEQEKIINEYKDNAAIEKKIDHLLNLFREKDKAEILHSDLETIIFKIEETQTGIASCVSEIGQEAKIDYLLALNSDLIELKKEVSKLHSHCSDIESCQFDIKNEKRNISGLEIEFSELMPDVCPLCGK